MSESPEAARARVHQAMLEQSRRTSPETVESVRRKAYAAARANVQEAWAALAMIRETVETLAPSGSVKAAEHLDGPTLMHEADALVAGIAAIGGVAQSPLMEATQAQHVGLPKGEPAKFVRSGKLETCQCRDCRDLAQGLPASSMDEEIYLGLQEAKMLIGAKNDTFNEAVKASNINKAWHILDRILSSVSSTVRGRRIDSLRQERTANLPARDR